MKVTSLIFIILLSFSDSLCGQQVGDEKSIASSYDSLRKYERAGSLSNGVRFAKQLLNQTEKEGNTEYQAKVSNTLSKLYLFQRKSDSSMITARNTIEMASMNDHFEELVNANNQIALIFFNRSIYDSSRVYYQNAMEIARDHRPAMYPVTLVNMAFINGLQDRREDEIDYYMKALDALEDHPEYDKSGGIRAMSYGGIGDYFLFIGEHEKARRNFEAKLKLGIEKNRKQTIYEAHGGLGNLFRSEEYYDFEKSKGHYLEIIKDTTKAYAHYRGNALIGLGRLQKKEKDYTSALKSFNRSLTIYEGLTSNDWKSRVQFQIGDVYLKMNRINQSEAWFKLALNSATEKRLPMREKDALKGLYKIDSIKGNYKLSFAKYRRLEAIEDSLNNLSSQDKIDELQVKYESEQKEKENLILKSNLELKQSEVEKQKLIQFIIAGVALVISILIVILYQSFRRKRKSNETLSRQNELISEQKEELVTKTQTLEELNTQLKLIAEFRNDMTRMIAHDMKNPLNAIIGLSNSTLKDKKSKNINQSGYQLLNLITNMLEVEKYEHTDFKLSTKTVALDRVVQQAKEQVDTLLEAKQLKLQSHISENTLVRIDQESMKRVFVNLFSNAIKYSEFDDVITVKIQEVENDLFQVEVSDNGIGIPEEKLPHIFERFWQKDAKNSGVSVSTGLGLTYCKMVIEAHKGKISASSKEGLGTKISLTIPKAVEEYNTEGYTNHENDIILLKEFDALKQVAQQLKEVKVHQISLISKAFKDIRAEDISSKWKGLLDKAVYSGDQNKFDELVGMFEENALV